MDGLLFALTLVAALGCGLSAGALFAFSSFVMNALGDLRPAGGIEAMQSINVQAPTPAFITALGGTGVLCLALGVWGIIDLDEDFGVWLLAGAALYLAGPIAVTMFFNVPRNNRLADLDPNSSEAAAYWARYLVEWTRWNHVRVALGVAAAAMFAVALTGG